MRTYSGSASLKSIPRSCIFRPGLSWTSKVVNQPYYCEKYSPFRGTFGVGVSHWAREGEGVGASQGDESSLEIERVAFKSTEKLRMSDSNLNASGVIEPTYEADFPTKPEELMFKLVNES
ncbi:hypothetical protein KQX54_021877 [Cotesia glomerata]|uniref:Uncharacterized protein n=1 Tax=Cotesia glomerata TaxID=32391 RepID=A0AAV7J9W9_COTGL|nr:hypothetical protein KQX54_021877 [Cotesia glomerata]